MKRLLITEIRRNAARRITRILSLGAVGILLIAAVITFFLTDTDRENDARSKSAQAREFADCMSRKTMAQSTIPQVSGEAKGGVTDAQAADLQVGESAEEKTKRCETDAAAKADSSRKQFSFTETGAKINRSNSPTEDEDGSGVGSVGQAVFGILGLLALIMSASYVGAEWRANTIGSLLTWEPRRERIFFAKMFAAIITCVLVSLGVVVVFFALFAIVAALHGNFNGVNSAWWFATLRGMLRAEAVVAYNAIFGVSFAFLFRNTAGVIVLAFVMPVFIESGVSYLLENVFKMDNAMSWMPSQAETAVAGTAETWHLWTHVAAMGSLRLAAYGAIFTAVAYFVFAKRDVAGST